MSRVVVGVAATPEQLDVRGGRVVWDGAALYASLIRWRGDDALPATSQTPISRARSTGLYTASRIGDFVPGWRGGRLRRRIRDHAQVHTFRYPDSVTVLYGHIVFPISRPTRPTVWSTNGVLDARPGSWFPVQSARTHRSMIRRAAVTQCWSELGRRGILEHAPDVPEGKIRVIPPLMYLDLPDRPRVRSGPDLTAIFVGAFGHMKGLDVVLEVARTAEPGVVFDIITATEPPGQIPSNVRWLGPRPHEQVLARMAAADIHVFPSTTESFGVVVVEAMALGLAQVVDGGSVTKELVGDTGMAVDGTDPQAVGAAVAELAGNDSLRHELAGASGERYRRVFAPEAVGPQLDQLFAEVSA